MTLRFEGETLTIGGEGPVTGTVIINVRITDARFAHHFGTEGGDEVEFTPDGFVPDKEFTALDGQLMRALWDWIDRNERLVERKFNRLSQV